MLEELVEDHHCLYDENLDDFRCSFLIVLNTLLGGVLVCALSSLRISSKMIDTCCVIDI